MRTLVLSVLLAVPVWGQCEQQEVFAPDGKFNDRFGFDVAVDGDVLAVGAPERDTPTSNAGAVYVYRRDLVTGSWDHEGTVRGSSPSNLFWFGRRIDVGGEWVVVGAAWADGPVSSSGLGYVFRFDPGSGTWIEHQQLAAPDAHSNHFFGSDIAIDGDRILVGSNTDGYLFQFDTASGQWLFDQKLTPSVAHFSMGQAVSIDGDVAVVTAHGDQSGGILRQGSAFVFERDPVTSVWGQVQMLIAEDGHWARQFGRAAAVSGDVIAVTAWDTEIPEVNGGAVYLHRRDPATGAWIFFQRLGSPLHQFQSRYGFSCDLDAGALLVGADNEGAAYLYELEPASGEYGLERRLEGEELVLPYFGASVSLSDRWAAVGAYRGKGVGDNTGSSWVFARESCAPVGGSYCGPAVANSTGVPARLQGAGVPLAGGHPLLMVGSDLPPTQPAMLLASETQGSFQPPGSQGILCLAGQIARFKTAITPVTGQGTVAIEVDTNAIPTSPPHVVQSGETWSFQLWYRDLNPGATSNFTDGVAITFQ